jgi:hypothetical protein
MKSPGASVRLTIAAPQPALHDWVLAPEFAELGVLVTAGMLDESADPPPDPQAVSAIVASRHNAWDTRCLQSAPWDRSDDMRIMTPTPKLTMYAAVCARVHALMPR